MLEERLYRSLLRSGVSIYCGGVQFIRVSYGGCQKL